jgi:hypothetical protein
MEARMPEYRDHGDVTVTVTNSVARGLIARAGLTVVGDGRSWLLLDGTITADPQRALNEAIVALVEED